MHHLFLKAIAAVTSSSSAGGPNYPLLAPNPPPPANAAVSSAANLLGQLFVMPPNNASALGSTQNSPNQICHQQAAQISPLGGFLPPANPPPTSLPTPANPLVVHRRVGRPPKHLQQQQQLMRSTTMPNGGTGMNAGAIPQQMVRLFICFF
jgi:hypothetical protein